MSGDQLQPEDTLDDRGVEDVLDEGFPPPEREPDHLRHPEGGESLEDRLDEEQPEVWARAEEEADADIVDGDVGGEVGASRSGRLLAPDEGSHEDVDAELVAEDRGDRRRRRQRRGGGRAHDRGRVGPSLLGDLS